MRAVRHSTRRLVPLTLTAGAAALALVTAGCGDDNNSGGGGGSSSGGKVAVLLPDSKSSVRWETVDRPLLKAAFDKAGVENTIQNAEGDKSAQQQQAEQAITNGAKVLLLVNLDSGSGAAIAANAKSQGVRVIDYDRLTLKGDSDYYVSFDNEQVGKLQGQGLVNCLGNASKPAVAVLNGSPTDNNATLFANGYNSVIGPKFTSGAWTKVADQSVPDWDNQKALTIFEQMLQKASNHKKEADAAAGLAIALAKGDKPTGVSETVDNQSRKVPSILLEPVSVTKKNIKQYFGAVDYPKRDDICVGKLAAKCKALGL
jgi:D-xylose transport system substrate-binding protein